MIKRISYVTVPIAADRIIAGFACTIHAIESKKERLTISGLKFVGELYMIIDCKRLIFWKDEDISDFLDGLNNINVSMWMADIPYPYTKQDVENFISYAKQLGIV